MNCNTSHSPCQFAKIRCYPISQCLCLNEVSDCRLPLPDYSVAFGKCWQLLANGFYNGFMSPYRWSHGYVYCTPLQILLSTTCSLSTKRFSRPRPIASHYKSSAIAEVDAHCCTSRAVFVRFSLEGGQSFDWRLVTTTMEVAKLVPWNSLLN